MGPFFSVAFLSLFIAALAPCKERIGQRARLEGGGEERVAYVSHGDL